MSTPRISIRVLLARCSPHKYHNKINSIKICTAQYLASEPNNHASDSKSIRLFSSLAMVTQSASLTPLSHLSLPSRTTHCGLSLGAPRHFDSIPNLKVQQQQQRNITLRFDSKPQIVQHKRLYSTANSDDNLNSIAASKLHRTCWSCAQPVSVTSFFCPNCKSVQPPPPHAGTRKHGSINYFTLLNCPVTYDVDLKELEKTYKNAQRQLHPDRFFTKPDKEKEYSEQYASEINRAYETLVKPNLRAQYLLELEGHGLEEGQGSLAGIDPEFLMDVMEIMESVHEIPPHQYHRLQDAQTQEKQQKELAHLKRVNDEWFDKVEREAAEVFADPSHLDVNRAKVVAAKLNYLQRIRDDIYERIELK